MERNTLRKLTLAIVEEETRVSVVEVIAAIVHVGCEQVKRETSDRECVHIPQRFKNYRQPLFVSAFEPNIEDS